MKELFINVISNGDYSLRDMLKKINERHINNDLTDEEKVELEEMARNNAKAINDYAPMEERLDEAFRRIETLENKVRELEGTETDKPVEGEEVVVEEYPEYVQPTGAHDAYKKGDKVTLNGKRYVSLIDNNVWAPNIFPMGWEEVKEVE